MDKKMLIDKWLEEEAVAHIIGWDFSHIRDRYEIDDDLPWDYRKVVQENLKSDSYLLDMDTGGGEFLLSLGHPKERISATEFYEPNVKLCKEKLLPLGINFCKADGNGVLPFEDGSFDIVLNRHGAYNPGEIFRVLKPGGVFITEQVGAENDRELVELILEDIPELPFPEQYLNIAVEKFQNCGFSIIEAQETFRSIRFWDVGALVWFAHVIEWEFPGFSVESCKDKLLQAQGILEKNGVIEGRIHRFLLVAGK